MNLTPERARTRQIRFKRSEQASADGLNQGMGIAVYAQDQSFRDPCPSQSEDGIPAFSPKGSRKTRFRQVLSRIKRYRHASCFRLNDAVLSNRDVANWTVNSHAKFTILASDLRETV